MDAHPLRDKPRPFRGWAVVCAALAAGGALWLGSWIRPELDEGLRSYRWPTTQGTLLKAERGHAIMGPSYEESYEETWLKLWYAYRSPANEALDSHRYDVSTAPGAGRRHRSSMIELGMAQQALKRAPRVRVYYDPERPQRAVLRPGIAFSTSGWLCLLLTLLGATVCFLRCVSVPAKKLAQREGMGPDGKPTKLAGPVMMLVMWLFLFPLGWAALACGLAGVASGMFGSAPPTWPLLGYLGLFFAVVLWPRIARASTVQPLLMLCILGIPVFAVTGLVLQVLHRETEVVYTIPAEQLLSRLQDPHPAVREAAAWAVFEAEAPAAAAPLLEALCGDEHPQVREAAASAAKRLRRRAPH